MSKKTFKLDNTLYAQTRITASIQAFSGYSIVFAQDALTIDEEEPQQIFDEFMNYVLALSNESLS